MTPETINLLQMVFTGIAALAAITATILAFMIGKKQNGINEQALNISNFVEVFLMPQQVIVQDPNDQSRKIIKWNVLIKNVSSYPIYLNDFTINGLKHDIGNSAIPNDPNSWYAVPILEDVQKRGEFSLIVSFEDYLGKKYLAEGFGKFDGISWQMKSRKRVEVRD